MALGETLKQKRLERGWTKEYVAERTHMMVRSIDALETESFKRIPAPLYGRGFIKQYCALLGLDPQPLVEEYMAKVSGEEAGRSVTHPVVHDLPDQPLAPIHTAGKRTLPPKEPLKETPVVTTHKTVEPPEASHTAVPRPETLVEPAPPPPPPTPVATTPAPKAPGTPSPTSPVAGKWVMPPRQNPTIPESIPAPLASELPSSVPQVPVEPPPVAKAPSPSPKRVEAEAEPAFALQGDPLPPSPPPTRGRSGLADLASSKTRPATKTRSVAATPAATTAHREAHVENSRAIFGPQQPIGTPPNPQWSSLRALFQKIGVGIAERFRRLTHPKVRRMVGSNEPLLTHRMMLKAATIFGVLVALTLVVLLFRWIFRQSEESEVESLTAPQEAPAETSPAKAPFRAPLPEPYFK